MLAHPCIWSSKFKEDMSLPGLVSIPKLQQLVLMDLAFLHALHLKWEDTEPGRFGCASAGSSDNDAPAPAASALQPAEEIDFMKWYLNSVPWDELLFSLTGSNTMKHRDVPQYLFPALCLASEMMMRHAKELKGMIKFFEECKAQIESAFGEGTDTFLLISGAQHTESGMLEQLAEWRRQLQVKDYMAEETEYIHSI
jgi:hypothetical protein